MTVRIVTDSTADISPEIARELRITIVPEYIIIGEKTYRDGIDISYDEIYERLINNSKLPSTSQPTPADFAGVYQTLSREADEIISIHLCAKLSGTLSSALQGNKSVNTKCNITVIDSGSLTMGLGLIVISAARMALQDKNPAKIIDKINEEIENTHLYATFDTLKYLALGGRIGKAQALFGSVLNVKPVITLRDCQFSPVGNFRTRAKAIDKLFDLARSYPDIKELAVIYSTALDEAKTLLNRLSPLVSSEHLYLARLGPALGVHGGPGTLALIIRTSGSKAGPAVSPSKSVQKKPLLRLPKLNLPLRR